MVVKIMIRMIQEVAERLMESVFRTFYGEYFFGEWIIPWLPDDL